MYPRFSQVDSHHRETTWITANAGGNLTYPFDVVPMSTTLVLRSFTHPQ